MRFKRKNVLCSNCGFLGLHVISIYATTTIESQLECAPRIREDFQKGVDVNKPNNVPKVEAIGRRMEEKANLFCRRLQWTLTWSKEDNDNYFSQPSEIRQSRQCRYYTKYHPGYTPAEHKELISEAKTRRTIVFATLLGASVGAAAAIIAGKLV